MSIKLFFEAIFKFALGALLVGLLIFLPAGTVFFLKGWIFMGVLFVPMLGCGIVMMIKNPSLLASRLNAKEKQKEQGIIIKLSGLMFVLGFVLAGLDYRFSWFLLPTYISYIFSAVLILAYIMWAEVLRENAYLSRTVKVEKNQRIVDTGLYGIVRHPMYTASIVLFLSVPLILGSLISLIPFLFYPFIIVARIKKEEELLSKELSGYEEYMKKVKYRLIPFIY